MKIVLDAMGGDNSPHDAVEGAVLAVKEYKVGVILVGDKPAIEKAAASKGLSLDGIEIVHAPEVFPITSDPTTLLKAGKDSSMAVGMQLVKDGGGDAFVSAGSTGALLVGATFIVGRIKGVKRPVLAAEVPIGWNKHYLLVDTGANNDCRPEMLLQFGIMGNIYMQKVRGMKSPRIGLVNIGTEETKGTDLQVESYALLKAANMNFIGNVEAREIPHGGCDVAVCDGFTGNIILKLSEGFFLFLVKLLKNLLTATPLTKVAALILKKSISDFRLSMDHTEVGGAPILGVNKPVIKAHGNSNANAFKNAIRQAVKSINENVVAEIEKGLAENK